MGMHVQICKDREAWNAWLERQGQEGGRGTSFLQSWEWGEFQSAYGRTVYRVQVMNGDIPCLAATLLVMQLPFGRSFLFSPRGPVFETVHDGASADSHHAVSTVWSALMLSPVWEEIVKHHRVVFLRCEPVREEDLSEQKSILLRRVKDVEPAHTLLLDLRMEQHVLFDRLKQKTRYNIRLAEKKGVRVQWHTAENTSEWNALVSRWWELLQETNERHGIRSHARSYYEHMVRVLAATGNASFASATHEGDVLAMNLLVSFGNTFTYLHGASSHIKKEFMAPYALQWACIFEAQRRGYHWYDFFGVSPEDQPHHALAGVTRFKKGFNGTPISYPGTFEFPISRLWYTIYRTAKHFR